MKKSKLNWLDIKIIPFDDGIDQYIKFEIIFSTNCNFWILSHQMDKEKQRLALIEYMKMQQQKIRPSVNTTTNAADLTKNNNNGSGSGSNRNSQCYSNILVIDLKTVLFLFFFLLSIILFRALSLSSRSLRRMYFINRRAFWLARQINNLVKLGKILCW